MATQPNTKNIAMGVYECEKCGEVMCGESFGCEQCDYAMGDGNILCEECAKAGNCDECGESMCIHCNDVGTFKCCGQNLCGGEDEYEGSCTDKHIVKTLDCGHKGCNYHDGACLSCGNENAAKVEKDAVKGDIAIIESVMDQIKSDRMKAALKSIVGDADGKKRKREVERVEELEFNLKRARNACSACRCGRASYY